VAVKDAHRADRPLGRGEEEVRVLVLLAARAHPRAGPDPVAGTHRS